MIKRRELCCIAFILLGTLILAFSSKISDVLTLKNSDEPAENESVEARFVSIRFSGEINVEEVVFTVPYGSAFGSIAHKLEKYMNEYSVFPLDRTDRFFADKDIVVPTADLKSMEEDTRLEECKVPIHTASKDELITLYGVGEKRADKIIEYRRKKRIESFEELKAIIGVSDEIIQRIKEKAVL